MVDLKLLSVVLKFSGVSDFFTALHLLIDGTQLTQVISSSRDSWKTSRSVAVEEQDYILLLY